MKVKDLIAELAKCPPDVEVRFFVGWDDLRSVAEVSPEDADGNVLLGCNLPPEAYARDFRDD